MSTPCADSIYWLSTQPNLASLGTIHLPKKVEETLVYFLKEIPGIFFPPSLRLKDYLEKCCPAVKGKWVQASKSGNLGSKNVSYKVNVDRKINQALLNGLSVSHEKPIGLPRANAASERLLSWKRLRCPKMVKDLNTHMGYALIYHVLCSI